MIKFGQFLLISVLYSTYFTSLPKAWGLVDYSLPSQGGDADFGDESSGNRPVKLSDAKGGLNSQANVIKGNHKSWEKFLEVSTFYDSSKVKGVQNEKMDRFQFETVLKARQDVSLEISYWLGQYTGNSDGKGKRQQRGNPKFLLGFNWISFGKREESTRIDLYGGMIIKENNSMLASSRDDKIVGVTTSKRIMDFILLLMGEFRATGRPNKTDDLAIGNITSYGVGMGWLATDDIRMSLHTQVYKIRSIKGAVDSQGSLGRDNNLARDLTFSVISPKVYLGILNNMELQLGLNVVTKSTRLETDDLLRLKLFDLPGISGNSFIVGLNFSV